MNRLVALVALFLLAGCGGGGGGASPAGPPAPLAPISAATATATPVPAPSSFSAVSTTALSVPAGGGVAPVSVQLPATGGFAGTAVLPIAASSFVAGTQLTQTLSNVAPTDAGLLSVSRAPLATSTVAIYLKITVSNPLTLASAPSFTFNLPAGFMQPNLGYYLAFFDGATGNWQRGFGGPATGGATALSVSGGGAVSFQPGITYYFALYGSASPATPGPTATPGLNTPPPGVPPTVPTPIASTGPTPGVTIGTPGPVPPTSPPVPGNVVVPTPVATATPGGVGITISIPTAAPILASPSSLTVPLGQSLTSILSEAGYGGGFSAATSNSSVATASVSLNGSGFYVLLVAAVGHGSCTITLSSINGGTGTLPVVVP